MQQAAPKLNPSPYSLDAAETFEIFGGAEDSAAWAAATGDVAILSFTSGSEEVGAGAAAVVIKKP